ncbi:MAG: FtsX-like permease family protein [Alistipes sp.]|nr:FtsX-like permease family protein [Alistipes sp.]
MLWFTFARRYMFSPKSHSVINIIAIISVVAVVVPTAAMVILLSIFGGLGSVIASLYSTVDGDIEVIARRGQTFDHCEALIERITALDDVAAAAPYIEQEVMASAGGRRTTLKIRGVDARYEEVIPIADKVERGALDNIFNGDIILGSNLASSLGAYGSGTEIELFALNRKQVSTLLPIGSIARQRYELGGVVHSNAEISSTLALAELESVQQLLHYTGRISGVVVSVTPDADIDATREAIAAIAGEDREVRTRDQKNASMNTILRMEKYAIMLIGALIALVATFSIVGSVVMLLTDKRRDIATLQAMGAPQRLIERIFVGEGMLLTSTGCIIGIIVGVALSLGQQHFGWIAIPGDSLIESYPVAINGGDIAMVALIVILSGIVISHFTVKYILRKNN